MKKKRAMKPLFVYGSIVLGLIVVLFLSIWVIPKALIVLTRASGSGRVSIVSSYFIGEKILAKSDGEDECIVNVFLLDKTGKGVANQTVEITGMDSGIEKINSLSNDMGKVSFRIVSEDEGQFSLRAIYGGVELSQSVELTFRK